MYEIKELLMTNKVSLFKRIRNLLPPTERAMENRHQDLIKRLYEINKWREDDLGYKTDELKTSIRTSTAQTKLMLWELLRQEGECLPETKRRFFRSLPEAEGAMRVLQLANAKILHDFKLFCDSHKLPFFLVAGTLLGAIRHGKAIPWDDDLDVGMVRSDVARLTEAVANDDRFNLTIVYDQWNCCKQVRFKYADETIPCFVDVFYFDYAPDLSDEHAQVFATERENLERAMRSIEQAYLDDPFKEGSGNDYKFVPNTNPLSEPFSEAVDTAVDHLLEAGVFCSKDSAQFLRWGVENIASGSQPNLILTDVFPLSEVEFEGEVYPAPCNSEAVLQRWFGDWLDLPNDMFSHPVHTSISDETLEILKDFIR